MSHGSRTDGRRRRVRTTLGHARPIRRSSVSTTGVKFLGVPTESDVFNPSPSRSKLTGGQKWVIVGLLFLQIPSSLIFYPLAALFAITGIFVPIAMVLMGIGTLPFSFAMKCKDSWQRGGVLENHFGRA